MALYCIKTFKSKLLTFASIWAIGSTICTLPFDANAKTPSDTLIIAWNIDAIITFDPAQIVEVVTDEIFQNMCNSLVSIDPNNEKAILPMLAQSWEVSQDNTQIKFHLRDDLKFADGRPASASDIEWALKRVVKLNFANAATLKEYGITADNIDEAVKAIDDKTLILKFDKPYPPQLTLTAIGANRVASALDRETIMQNEKNGDFGNQYLITHTACVGPYELQRWNAGEGVLLTVNKNYWGAAPKLRQILIRHVGEPGTQRLLLEKGDIDVARDLTPEDVNDLEKNTDVVVSRILRPTLNHWSFNTADPIFSNEKVRLAMRYLIDYEGLSKTVLKGVGVTRASFVQLGAFGALDEAQGQPFSLDIEKAKSLLVEAGYKDGFEASVLIGTHPYSSPIAQSIQDNASKIGVKLKIERMANSQLFSKVRSREFQTAMYGWAASVPDAHSNASRLIYNPDNRLEAKNAGYPSWRASYFDENVNNEILAALFEKDPQKREQRYFDLQKEMFEKGPQAYIFQLYNVAGLRPEIKKWVWNGYRAFYDLAEK
ncbi:ABC transporter substrate-binding protein (plasmid) [Bartonella sp. HY329]|uniref:ABC transporter substrate-binding protein n=1 Tax=unclassified Bartonella TaxID=2645622 RepID=UPI0021C684F8|nr:MULTISPECIES: ABC transporter substrate-binding protein [unclassified Bartonella]UXM96600.1 ABC transporter substrate-binding protein [Bartonella sp. HY329]UXN10923.1 ABC transporter substrate-binding protein [Bartonella sp. HY328]